MPIDIFGIKDTYSLMAAVQQIKQPSNFLSELFFPKKQQFNTSYVAVEYRKEDRLLAPFIVSNSRGVNINRGGSKTNYYTAPMFAPRRVIGLKDLEMRQFGEQPNIYSPVKPEERVAKMQAEDLAELLRMHANRKNQIASSILQTGKVKVGGYADDGVTEITDEIDFDLNCEYYPSVSWADANANIYEDLMTCSEHIQEATGLIPNVMICGKGVERNLLANKEIRDWLLIPNRESLTMASFTPHYTAPNARFIGYISALNLEIISYMENYVGDDGQKHPYIDDNTVIFGNAGQGFQLYGTVTLFDAGGVQTYAAEYIPKYTYSEEAQQYALTVYSRYMLVPNVFSDWTTIRTLGV